MPKHNPNENHEKSSIDSILRSKQRHIRNCKNCNLTQTILWKHDYTTTKQLGSDISIFTINLDTTLCMLWTIQYFLKSTPWVWISFSLIERFASVSKALPISVRGRLRKDRTLSGPKFWYRHICTIPIYKQIYTPLCLAQSSIMPSCWIG